MDHLFSKELELGHISKADSKPRCVHPYFPNCFHSIVDIKSLGPSALPPPPHRELQGFRWMFGTQDSSRYNYYVDN